MSHHIVEARALSYTYPDGTHALDGVTFRITHGECVAIIGANGAGKSTLLQHCNGFLLPTQGEMRVGEYAISKKNLNMVRRSVGVVFQNPDDQLFMPTVYDDVAFGPLNMGLSGDEVDVRVKNALKTVGAVGLEGRPPYRLSGGEKRAVAIASVIAMTPDVLVMDEPSSNLDPSARKGIINMLMGFKHTRIIATHDLDLVLDLCSRAIILHQGKLVEDGPVSLILSDRSLLAKYGLELPLRLQGCPVCAAARQN